MTLAVDTHVLLWWLGGEGQLSSSQLEALERAEAAGDPLGLPAICLWEIAKLVERGRLELHAAADVFLEDIEEHPRLQVLPLTARVALESTRLGSAFHADPADQLIVATARVHGLRLVTADERIRRSGVVSVV